MFFCLRAPRRSMPCFFSTNSVETGGLVAEPRGRVLPERGSPDLATGVLSAVLFVAIVGGGGEETVLLFVFVSRKRPMAWTNAAHVGATNEQKRTKKDEEEERKKVDCKDRLVFRNCDAKKREKKKKEGPSNSNNNKWSIRRRRRRLSLLFLFCFSR